jgi:hypothetical protein
MTFGTGVSSLSDALGARAIAAGHVGSGFVRAREFVIVCSCLFVDFGDGFIG